MDMEKKIIPALKSVEWEPFNASFSHVICNHDGSIILLADNHTQVVMHQLVSRFEAAIEATGLPVVPRSSMEDFHITIGTTNSTYPMPDALEAINHAIPTWSAPVLLRAFIFPFPPTLIVAKETE